MLSTCDRLQFNGTGWIQQCPPILVRSLVIILYLTLHTTLDLDHCLDFILVAWRQSRVDHLIGQIRVRVCLILMSNHPPLYFPMQQEQVALSRERAYQSRQQACGSGLHSPKDKCINYLVCNPRLAQLLSRKNNGASSSPTDAIVRICSLL